MAGRSAGPVRPALGSALGGGQLLSVVADATPPESVRGGRADDPRPAAGRTAGRARAALPLALAVALAASPVVVAALALLDHPWLPVGDMAHQLFRVGQVGTRGTPLVGAETIKGFAHPGPLEFYLATPLHRLTGGDARALSWTAAIINVVAIAGVCAVAWRRGRVALLLPVATLVAVLVHTLGPAITVSLWNPHVPLLTFLLVVFLAWDVGLGNRRSLLPLALAATFAAQTHFAFSVLLCVVTAWLVAWVRWWPRLLPAEGAGDLPRPPWQPWAGAVRRALLVMGVLWLPPLFDALFDLHNPVGIGKSIFRGSRSVGPLDAPGLVGRYLRIDGPWIGGEEPSVAFSVQGSGPLPLLVGLAVLVACIQVGRRRGLVDVVALGTLVLALAVGALPATSQIPLPAYAYLTQFLKLTGGLLWLTAAWTLWRVAEPWVRARVAARRLAGAAMAVALVAATAWSWGDAAGLETPHPLEERAVQQLRPRLRAALDRDDVFRVEYRGDPLNIVGPGVIYWMIEDGFDVLTQDGAHGLKWGHAHRWQHGEAHDTVLTVAVRSGGSPVDTIGQCEVTPSAHLVAQVDMLSADERAELDALRWQRQTDAGSVTAADRERGAELGAEDMRIAVYEGPGICARNARRPR